MKEQLSACLDGELPPAELDLLLKRLERDPQLRHSIGRYALIGEALRAARPACASNEFHARVAAAVRGETMTPVPRRSAAVLANRWLRPAAGMAVAASVAAIAIFALQAPAPDMPGVSSGPDQVADVGAQTSPDAAPARTAAAQLDSPDNSQGDSSYIVPTGTPAQSLVSAARLTNYAVAHSEYSSPLGRRTVLSGVLSAEADEEANEDESAGDAALESGRPSPQR